MNSTAERKRRNKSYVLRSGRMTKLQKRALEELLPEYGIAVSEEKIEPAEVFPVRRPVILEIGFGMGEATVELADGHRDYNFIGIEVYPKGVGKVLDEIRRRGLDNLRVIHHDAVPVVETMFPEGSLEGVHIFFPDPWPKKKHHKRRLINRRFASILAEKIRRGGYIYVVTDWEDYAFSIVDTLDCVPELVNAYEVFAPSRPWRPKTSFEQKGIGKDHLIREILFEKRSSSEDTRDQLEENRPT